MTTPYIDPNTVAVIGTGDPVPSDWFGTVRDSLETLARAPGCQVNRTASQSVANASWTSVLFTAADERDTDNFHSTVTDPQNLVIPSGLGGWYTLRFWVDWTSNSSGTRGQRVQVNGATQPESVYLSAANGQNHRSTLTSELLLASGDVVVCDVYQNSGGSLNLLNARATLRLVAWS